jgi:hypothetical protein
MPAQVYRIKTSDRARLETALTDDILSRQSLTLRDARHFGVPGEAIFLFVEGAEAGVARADKVLLEFAEHAPDAKTLLDLLKAEEDEAASGLGSIFGEP